jgi:RNA polymerase sigma factor (TIGR02999 family)
MGEITSLLKRFGTGDPEAEARLFELVYGELHRMARRKLLGERRHHTLQASALVNEAYVKLNKTRELDWHDRAHFFAVASRCMRQVLIDYAKRRHPIAANLLIAAPRVVDSDTLIRMSDLLDELAKVSSRQCSVVELHFFSGFTFRQVADLLGLAERTIRADWAFARAWLHHRMRTPDVRDS